MKFLFQFWECVYMSWVTDQKYNFSLQAGKKKKKRLGKPLQSCWISTDKKSSSQLASKCFECHTNKYANKRVSQTVPVEPFFMMFVGISWGEGVFFRPNTLEGRKYKLQYFSTCQYTLLKTLTSSAEKQ